MVYKLNLLLLTTIFIANSCVPSRLKTDEIPADQILGIRIVSLRLSAEGYMLDLRFMVKEPERAKLLFNHKVKPYLIEKRTGARFLVPDSPKIGSLRQISKLPEPGKIYFILFANPGRFLKKGDRVYLVIGDLRTDEIIIE